MSVCLRPARAEARILDATLAELAAKGFAGVTVDGIAAVAGVGRATIYRHWATKADVVMAAIRAAAIPPAVPDTGALRSDLAGFATALGEALAEGPFGVLLPVLVEASHRDPELAVLHRRLSIERRAEALRLVDRAVERSELPTDVDRELLLDLVTGCVFSRHLVQHRATSAEAAAAMVDRVLAGFLVGEVRS